MSPREVLERWGPDVFVPYAMIYVNPPLHISADAFAQLCGMHRRTLYRRLAFLQRQGLIGIVRQSGMPAVYTIKEPKP